MQNAAVSHSRCDSGACGPAAPEGLRPGVTTDGNKAIRDQVLSALVAATAALLCAAIDHLTKEEHQ